MKKVLCLFDYGKECFTGYATVSRNIIKELKKKFGDDLKMDICALNYFGEPYEEYNGTIRVASAKLVDNKHDDFGRLFFIECLRDNEYDAIFIIGDLGSIAPIIPLIKMTEVIKRRLGHKTFKKIIYFPVDGYIHEKVKNLEYDKEKEKNLPEWQRDFFNEHIRQLDELTYFDTIVTYTEYAKKEICKIKPSLRHRIKVLYHGINTKDFFPIDPKEREKFRKAYFGENNCQKFIISIINRNQPRKDIPTAIYSFIQARKIWDKDNLPKPFLYLHMDKYDPNGWNLELVMQQTGLVENKDYQFSIGQTDVEILNLIYNASDLYVSTARGGGWELSVTEAMASKVPVICPNHTSMGEIGADGRAFLLEEFLPIVDVTDNTFRSMCHYEEVAENIVSATEKIVAKADEFLPTEKAYKWVTKYTWENVCKEWIKIFEDI